MKIFIAYDSSWENSFLEGSIEEQFNENRSYIGSGSQGYDQFKSIAVSKTTVMGILNRLIGDQRRLFQINNSNNNFFKDIESKIHFKEKEIIKSKEIVFLRNINIGSEDRNAMCGIRLEEKNELFKEKYFKRFWAPLFMTEDQLLNLLFNDVEVNVPITIPQDRYAVGNFINEYTEKNKNSNNIKIKDIKSLSKTETEIEKMLLKSKLLDKEKIDKGLNYKILVYCSLYKLVEIISKEDPHFYKNLSPSKTIQGISKRSFTLREFLKGSATIKKVSGNPSAWEGFTKVDGINKKGEHFLTKKSGLIEISLDIDSTLAKTLKEKIDNAGVLSFNLGKKGLAYVEKILI